MPICGLNLNGGGCEVALVLIGLAEFGSALMAPVQVDLTGSLPLLDSGLTDAGCLQLARALVSNSTLTCLNLQGTFLSRPRQNCGLIPVRLCGFPLL